MITLRFAAVSALASLCAAAAAPSARAQVTSSLDAATSSVAYDDGRGDDLVALTPALDLAGGMAALSLSGTLAARQTGGLTSRGGARASIAGPRLGPIRVEGIARSGWDAFQPGGATGYWRGEARASAGAGAHGAWLSLGRGRALDGGGWSGISTAGAGVWTRIGSATLGASVTSARGGASLHMQLLSRKVPIRDTVPGADSIIGWHTVTDTSWARSLASNTDAQATLSWARGPLALELSGGRRLAAGAEMWGGAQAMYWLGPRIAVVAAGGSLPSSIADGRAASRYVTFGMRYAGQRRSAPGAPPASGARAGPPRPPLLEVEDAAGGTRAIRVRLPEGARTVELMGDFTDWSPVPMRPDGAGAWVAAVPVSPGTHRVNLRVNGGAWRVPPGLAPVTDDFNGTAGLLIVR